MARCRPKLVLALGTARLARTCVRPLPARPIERNDYALLSHAVQPMMLFTIAKLHIDMIPTYV